MSMFLDWMRELWATMGFQSLAWQQPVMWLIGAVLVYLAIRHEFEPLLLLPMARRLQADFVNAPAGTAFNALLFRTVKLELAFGALVSAGAILQRALS